MKTILITGGSSGIGLSAAQHLATPQHHLILIARNRNSLRAAAEELTALGAGKVTVYSLDLSDDHAVRAVVEKLEEDSIQVDILINNAGWGQFKVFTDQDPADIQSMIDLNISCLTQLTRALLPQLKKRKGRIVNIASVAGFMPGPYMSVYYATKAYVRSLTFGLRQELMDSGITATSVSPGPVDTNFADTGSATSVSFFKNALPVEAVGKLVAQAATTANPKPEYVTGLKHRSFTIAAKLLPWNLVAKLVKIIQSA